MASTKASGAEGDSATALAEAGDEVEVAPESMVDMVDTGTKTIMAMEEAKVEARS
jgi:hypothetical protein